jgi:putative phosphoserine phosphatase/1-acylglycerol-3-phosphate O-acyltransferase
MEHPLVVEAGEPIPGSAAFFDLDRTLVRGFTARAFLRERLRGGHIGVAHGLRTARDAWRFDAGYLEFSEFLVRASELYAGMSEADLVAIGQRIFRKEIAGAIYPEAYALFAAHHAAGRPVVIVSSATRYQAAPVAEALGADALICSELEVEGGILTGRVRSATYGPGKLEAARQFCEDRGLDLAQSFFYSDGIEDLPLLEQVGQPRPLNPDRRLRREAERRGWPVSAFTSRGLSADAVARTGLGIGAMIASISAGLPLAFAGDVRAGRNLTESLFGDLGTAIAGIELEVDGEANLWSHRPAVFLFNHQSAIEPLLLCKLLRRDFVGIAKAELQGSLFRPAFDYAGAVYVERFDRSRAIEALKPVVQALHGGTSVVIAPEGTRSSTPRPGPFKKGAFHIAQQAQVPIVPIVFHNSLDALPKKGRLVHPATIRVTVLPPISPAGWTEEEAGEKADEVRGLYLRTLGYDED